MSGIAQPRPHKPDHARSSFAGHAPTRLLHQFLCIYWTREVRESRRRSIYSREAGQYPSMSGRESLLWRWHQVPTAASAAA